MRKLNTADIFALIRLAKQAGIKEDLQREFRKLINGEKSIVGTDDLNSQEGMELVFAVISAFGTKGAEQAFYEFLSGPFEMNPDDIGNLPPDQTLKMIQEIGSLKDWTVFFGRAVKLDK